MEDPIRRVGARELKQHTGAVIERVQRGERLLLTHRGSPIAIIAPIDRAAFDELLNRDAADAESLGWIKVSEPAFRRRLGLHYVAIDCAETRAGELLIFEGDNAMIVHAMDPEQMFPYKKPAMRKVFAALRQLLEHARQPPETAVAA